MSGEDEKQHYDTDCRDEEASGALPSPTEVIPPQPTSSVFVAAIDEHSQHKKQQTDVDHSKKTLEPIATTGQEATAKFSSTSDEVPVATITESQQQQQQQISKNQLKKRRRREKALEINQRKKQRKKQVRYERAKAAGRDIDSERIQQEKARIQNATNSHRIKRTQEWQQTMMPKIKQSHQICIDCSYESYMTPKEINSLAIQIRYCYSSNKRSTHPCQLTATSIGCNQPNNGDTKMEDNASNSANNKDHNVCVTLNHLRKVNGFDEWSNYAFQITSDSFDQYFHDKLQNVVYLTSDSATTITALEDDKIYVIGGIVDRNRYKQLTYNRARELGVATAKLPIDEYLSAMPSTRVLTTNHVFDLLLKYREYNGCWKKALADVLPIRKDAKFVKEEEDESDDNVSSNH